jgi:hypothetical protein
MRPRLVTAILLWATLGSPRVASALDFVHWTSADLTSNVAIGTIGSMGVRMEGGDINFLETDVCTSFSLPVFTPPIPTTDCLQFVGNASGYNYTVTFDSAVLDPVIHLRSLASTCRFPGKSISRISGDPGFVVAGDSVSGFLVDDPSGYDENGTIRLDGVQRSFTFTARFQGVDGIYIQIGLPTVVGVPAGGENVSFAVSPDPTRGALDIAVPAAAEPWRIGVFDLGGRRIWSGNAMPGTRARWEGTNVAGRQASPGIYLVRIESGQTVFLRRVVRLN